MKKLITIFICLLPFFSEAQTANAGQDKTIYLTDGNSANLDGSGSSGDSYQWTEISTDYMSGGTITNPTSKSTTVTGLPQGVFYFQITVNSTHKDTMKVVVDYAPPPTNGTLYKIFDLSDPNIYTKINNRADTTNYYSTSNTTYGQTGVDPNRFYLYRARSNGLTIDSERGKLLSLNEDGYAGMDAGGGLGLYPRSEIQFADNNFKPDTLHTYMYEWKGYFPQNTNWMQIDDDPDWATILTIFQQHGLTYDYAVEKFEMEKDGTIYFRDEITGSKSEVGSDTYELISTPVGTLDDFYNKAHTFRITMRLGLGYPGQDAFVKVEMDGNQIYYRNTGGVGSAFFDDYIKFAGIYDWRSWLTDVDSLSRGRKWGLVTESFKVYQMSDVAAPTISLSGDQTITENNTSIHATAVWASGHSGTYSWTKVSGGSATITSPSSSSTTVTGLSTGTYVFRCTATQDDSQTAYAEVTIDVAIPPVITPSGNSIFLRIKTNLVNN